jgi:hypothetical protein
VFFVHENTFLPTLQASLIYNDAFLACFFALFLRLLLSEAGIHFAFSLCSFIFEIHFSPADKRVYHNAQVVHHTISTAPLNASFHHSTIFFHDSLAFFIASCFFVIMKILIW